MTSEHKSYLEKEVNFLVFWGRYGRETVKKMPRWKRQLHIKLTEENLKLLFGSGD